MPSGGSVRLASFFSFVFYFPSFLPVGRRSRALFSLLLAREQEKKRRGRERKRDRHEKKKQRRTEACERCSRRGKFRGRKTLHRPTPLARVRALEPSPSRISRAILRLRSLGCVSLTPHDAFRIPINSRLTTGIVNFHRRNSRPRLTLCCEDLVIFIRVRP